MTVNLPAGTPAHDQTAEPRRGRVLVVDDEEVVRRVVAQMVQMLGYDACLAHTGREALELLSQQGHAIDLILLDRTMPGQDGATTLAELRRRGFRQRVVISSGCAETDGAVAGAHGFIQKPYSMERLRQALQDAMSAPEASR